MIVAAARVNEDADHYRQFTPEDEIVHHVLRAQIAVRIHEGLPPVTDHEAGGNGWFVLRGKLNPIGVLGTGIGITRQRERPADFAFGNAWLRQRVGTQAVERIGVRGL
jgi:hypothetical protein